MSINRGARFTNDARVSISAAWPAFAKQMLVSNDGGFAVPGRFAVAIETPWRLDSSGPERLPKTVYARFDESSQTFTDDIILDETAPTVSSATATPTGATATRTGAYARRRTYLAAARKRTYRVTVSARDATSGVGGLQITSNKRKPGKLRRYKRSARLTKTVRYATAVCHEHRRRM